MKNFKYHLLFFSLSLLFFKCYSQNNINPEWLINSNGDEWGVVSDQVTDENGMIYLTGNFTSSFGLGNSSEKLTGNNCIFIAKVKPNGCVDWIKKISCTNNCSANSIIVGHNGYIYLSGNFNGEINEGNFSLNSSGKKNAFIVKFDTRGKVEWGSGINGNFRNKHIFLSQDSKGDLIFAGSFSGELFLNNSHFDSRYYYDIAIAKLNDEGEITGSQIMGGKADDLVNDLTLTRENEIIITGSFEKEFQINEQTLLSNGQMDIFMVKLDENLRLIQAHQFGGVYDDIGKTVLLDNENNLLLAGTFTDRLYFNKSYQLESTGKCDVFLSKFDENDKLTWCKSFGGAANDYVNSMDINNSNDIYLIGSYRGTIERGSEKIESEEFSSDIFLVKYSAEGDFHLIESFGGENNDFGRTICLDKSNNIYVNGNYSNSIKLLGNASTSHESEDFFVSRLYECGTTNKVLLPSDTTVVATKFLLSVADDFERYFWNGLPGSNELWVDTTGVYTIETIDKHQCISRDTICVQLNKPPEIDLGGPYSLVQGETITLKAPEGMKEYLWNDHSTQPFIDINTSNLDPGDYSYWVEVKDENGGISHGETLVEVVEDKGSLSGNFKDTPEQSLIVNLFPNPVKDKLFLNLSGLDVNNKLILELYTQGGILLKQEKHDVDERFLWKEIKISPLPSGTYFILIRNGDMVVISKVEVI
jgi:hypothetical protein